MMPRRRWRARAAANGWSRAACAVLVVAGLLHARAARAQVSMAATDTTIDTQLFQPAIGPRNFLTLDSPSVPEHKLFGLGLMLHYQHHAYSVFTQGGNPSQSNLVDHQLTMDLGIAMGLFGRYQVGVAIPFTPYLAGDEIDAMGMPKFSRLTESGIGDIRVEGKALIATLGEDEDFTLGVSAGLSLPTGKNASRPFLGDKTVTGRIKALALWDLGQVQIGANLGLLVRQTSHSFATELGPQVLYGAAVVYPVDRKIDVMLELFGRSGLNQFIDFYSDVNPFEMDIAGRYAVTGMWSVTVGGGRGFGNGIGAPDLRLFAGAVFMPDYRDRDKDGIHDVDDKCPDQPEDRDGHQDTDGCPDPDNDGDTLPDAQDKCPNDPEDVDQFQDEDGCPEADNDKDGIPDINDPCPNAAEDGNGKRPKDGCPSTTEDSDGDGVPDATDKSPHGPRARLWRRCRRVLPWACPRRRWRQRRSRPRRSRRLTPPPWAPRSSRSWLRSPPRAPNTKRSRSCRARSSSRSRGRSSPTSPRRSCATTSKNAAASSVPSHAGYPASLPA